MSRFLLALRCFFAVLFRSSIPTEIVPLVDPALWPEKEPVAKLLPPGPPPVEVAPPPSTPAVASPPPVAETASERLASCHRGAVQLLGMLQREGRLLDFLMEEIDSYSDGQIGAAVRDIHRGCRKALKEHLQVRAIRSEPDEAVVRVAEGYDPSQLRLVGKVSGRPPFEGTLRHHGWRASQMNLADIPAGHDPSVICPAEVELGA